MTEQHQEHPSSGGDGGGGGGGEVPSPSSLPADRSPSVAAADADTRQQQHDHERWGRLWSTVALAIPSARDLVQLAHTCRSSRVAIFGGPDALDATKPGAGGKHGILVDWLLTRFGKNLAFYEAYRLFPYYLTQDVVIEMLEKREIVLPRYLVLILSRERIAQEDAREKLRRHLIYREELLAHIEYTAKVLEVQRLGAERKSSNNEADGIPVAADASNEDAEPEADDILDSLIHVPTVPEVVEAPHPVPSTPTLLMPSDSRDLIIGLGKGKYGLAFPPSSVSPADWRPLETLPEDLHWVLAQSSTFSQNPFQLFPPDDAAFLEFLFRLAENSNVHGRPEEKWRRVCLGIRALVFRFGMSAALAFGPKSAPIAPWATTPTQGRHSINPNADVVDGWLPSELFLHDPELAAFLARSAGLSEQTILEETEYWILIQSKIHIPPKRYTPSLPHEEQEMWRHIGRLSKPINRNPIRRLLLNHANATCVARLAKFVDHSTLRVIGESLLSDLINIPSPYPGTPLKAAKALVEAFRFPLDIIAQCFLVPQASETLEMRPETEDDNDSSEYSAELEDVLASYDDGVSPSDRPRRHLQSMMTKLAQSYGTIPWAYWKWAISLFTPQHLVATACLHDLSMKFAVDDPNSTQKRWLFAEKETDAAVKSILDENVFPANRIVQKVCKRILRNVRVLQELAVQESERAASVIERAKAFHAWNDNAFLVPARFVLIMAAIEDRILKAIGPRAGKPQKKRSQRMLELFDAHMSQSDLFPDQTFSPMQTPSQVQPIPPPPAETPDKPIAFDLDIAQKPFVAEAEGGGNPWEDSSKRVLERLDSSMTTTAEDDMALFAEGVSKNDDNATVKPDEGGENKKTQSESSAPTSPWTEQFAATSLDAFKRFATTIGAKDLWPTREFHHQQPTSVADISVDEDFRLLVELDVPAAVAATRTYLSADTAPPEAQQPNADMKYVSQMLQLLLDEVVDNPKWNQLGQIQDFFAGLILTDHDLPRLLRFFLCVANLLNDVVNSDVKPMHSFRTWAAELVPSGAAGAASASAINPAASLNGSRPASPVTPRGASPVPGASAADVPLPASPHPIVIDSIEMPREAAPGSAAAATATTNGSAAVIHAPVPSPAAQPLDPQKELEKSWEKSWKKHSSRLSTSRMK
ncbi:hypothetical protein DFJ73DRAFT_231081 [Zopfochytrium polystomum]|nr:hypothetical protein DFJ73DRAFT_231081 [Zopfochytrium polystomum]